MTGRKDRLRRFSVTARAAWGKTDGYEAERWMPLVQHLIDSADVADEVWTWLPRHTREHIESCLPADARDGRLLLRWLAGVHDIGKCSPPFASKVPHLEDQMRRAGFEFPRDRSEFARAPHGVVGQEILTRWLIARHGADPATARTYAVVVGGHHGVPPTDEALGRLRRNRSLVGTALWPATQDEILDAIAAEVGVDGLLAQWAGSPLPPTAQALLTGAVIVSDWLASNIDLFPYDVRGEERATKAWEELGLPSPWDPAPPPRDAMTLASGRFPFLAGMSLRPVQEMTVAAAWEADSPPLLIVEATMGSGKTEAALLAAEVLAHRFGCGGIYVALPTMATSDAMFGRVLDWIERLGTADATSTYLAHGKSGLNERYAGLARQQRAPGVCDGGTSAATEARVLSWLTGRKKGVLANMVVGTIDQLLFTALQAKHVALRHLAFAGKVVVIDEAHAADDYMRVYLTRALEWLATYGVPVVLMSATLPYAQRCEYADAYRRGLGAEPPDLPAQAPYPCLTSVTADATSVTGPGMANIEPSRTVSVSWIDDELPTLVDLLEESLGDGGCAAVIRNTVGRAQETAAYLREHLDGVEIELIHSRFIATHRAEKEARLRAELGRDRSARPTRKVVIGTQVLEQSLDIDFDLMVSDLAPIDLLLQRAGRLHRHECGPGARPPRLRNARLLVTGIAEWDGGAPIAVPGSRAVYGSAKLLRSAAVLGLAEGDERAAEILFPSSIRPLVEAGYAPQAPGPESWRDRIEAADKDHRRDIAAQRQRADTYLLPNPEALADLVNWLEYGDRGEAEDARTTGASRVRDSDDGVEVIVVQRRSDGNVVVLEDGGPMAGRQAVYLQGQPPPPEVARQLAAMTVRLPLSLTNGRTFEATVSALEVDAHAGWQESPWLTGQLALHLDDDWTCELAGHRVSYQREDGLVVAAQREKASR